jgi:VanZ family protein
MVSGQKEKNLVWRGRIIRYAPLLLWAGVILFLSSSQGSMAETSRFIGPLIKFFFPSAAPETFLIVHAAVRKTAHFVEYAVFAFFAARAFSNSSVDILKNFWVLATFAAVVLVAMIDESNQSFNTSRTGSVWDVLLDISGGTTMIVVYFMFKRRADRSIKQTPDPAR